MNNEEQGFNEELGIGARGHPDGVGRELGAGAIPGRVVGDSLLRRVPAHQRPAHTVGR